VVGSKLPDEAVEEHSIHSTPPSLGNEKSDAEGFDWEADIVQPVFPSKWQKPTTSFYGSVEGFHYQGRQLTPLFWRPVELLANCTKLYFDHKVASVKGTGRLVKFSEDTWSRFNTESDRHLTKHELDAMRAEDLKIYFAAQKLPNGDPTPLARRYFRNLRILEFQRCTFDALVLPFQLMRVKNPYFNLGATRVRIIARWKSRVIHNPLVAAAELKRWAGIARAHFFEDKQRPPLPQLLIGLSKRQLLDFSYVGRALPPPARQVDALSEYVDRLTSEPPPENPEWRPFLRKYFKDFAPKTRPQYRTDPSVSASFGYSRKTGGFTRAVQDLVSFGVSLYFLREVDRLPPEFEGSWGLNGAKGQGRGTGRSGSKFFRFNDPSPPSYLDDLRLYCLANESRYSFFLRIATHATLRMLDYVPLSPIYAEEKGLKARYPAVTAAAANLVYQLFRRAIDSHLFTDPRHSHSLGGPIPVPMHSLRNKDPGSYYYSQDLSFATDLHPFWLTRTAYEEVILHHPALKEFEVYFPKLFGPHRIICKEEIPLQPQDDLRATQPAYVMDLEGYEGLFQSAAEHSRADYLHLDRKIKCDEPFYESCRRTVQSFSDFYSEINSNTGPLTTTSASMGDSTSFPVMPLLTTFAAEKAGLPTHITAGDDAVLADTVPRKEEIFESTVASCGAVLSRGDPSKGKPNKIFKHKTKLMFCEGVWDSHRWGKRPRIVPTQHLSLWTAPPGGSKGAIDWFNQPSSVAQHFESQGIPGRHALWKYTKTWHSALAAFTLGLPVGASVALGGISHPRFPPMAGRRKLDNQKWLNKISQLTRYDLAMGTSLAALPTGQSAISRRLARKAIELLEHKVCFYDGEPCDDLPALTNAVRTEGRLNVPLADAADACMRITSSWEIYNRPAPSDMKTPSIRKMRLKFFNRIGKAWKTHRIDKELSFHNTMLDVATKVNTFVDHRHDLFLANKLPMIRSYGIMNIAWGPKDKYKRFDQQWEHKSVLRMDRAYLGQKSDSVFVNPNVTHPP
jgi:hypothetical protein